MLQPTDFFLVRRPVFSVRKLTKLQEQLLHHSLEELLREWYGDPIAQEAIYLASPGLYERFARWLAGEQLSNAEKLLETLHKYAIRMSTRCTPYGLFAGCALGYQDRHTRLRTKVPQPTHRHVRLDIECLMVIRDWLLLQPEINNQVLFYTNNSLYAVGQSFRYVEQQRTQTNRKYFITAIVADSYLKTIFRQAKTGATLAELITCLVESGVEAQESSEFIQQLIDEQLLVTDLEPTLIGQSYLDELVLKVRSLPNTEALVDRLVELPHFLSTTPHVVALSQQIKDWLQQQQITEVPNDLIQLDSFYGTGAPAERSLTVGHSAIEHLTKQLRQLVVLNQPFHCPDLDDFKRRFHNRYEDEEISLSLALDGEFGIGYGVQSALGVGYAPMIDDLSLPNIDQIEGPPTWNWWQSFILQKYSDNLYHHRSEIELTEADLEQIKKQYRNARPRPDSFYVFGSWLAKSSEAIDKNEYLFSMQACKGPSAVNLLSRFCVGNPQLTNEVQHCIRATEAHHPDVIFAEIVHFPENRAGNILTRPTLYRYEIPYLGQPSVDKAHQLLLDDLMVSVRNNQVVLRSRQHNKRVIPRLTNAHNYHQGLPIYRFLCDLQHQDSHMDVKWNWSVLSDQGYLPRVRYGNIILSRATWQLKAENLQTDNLFQLAIQLNQQGLPQEFVVSLHDHELLINLHIPESLQLLAQELRKQATVRVFEFLATAENCPVSVSGQPFLNEVVIPCYDSSAPSISGLSPNLTALPQRRFTVGSEWLYLKVYTGEKSSDSLLVHVLLPVIQELLAKGIINQFFFVRYKDSDPHLRLRFKGNPHLDFYHFVMRQVELALRELVQEGVVHRIQLDTYVREIERYGHEQIELSEAIFHCDSLSTLAFLANSQANFDENGRFAYAVTKINQLVEGAGLSIGERCQLLNSMKEGFFAEFSGDVNLRRQQNEKFRYYRPIIETALCPTVQSGELTKSLTNCTSEKLMGQLRAALPDTVQFTSILQSLIHMVVNRLFPAKQRAYELVLYHCLAKYYDSQQARQVPVLG